MWDYSLTAFFAKNNAGALYFSNISSAALQESQQTDLYILMFYRAPLNLDDKLQAEHLSLCCGALEEGSARSMGCSLGSINKHSLLKKKNANLRINQFMKYVT